MSALIECKNLNFSYDKSKHIIENLNLEVHDGETFGLVGESGCGKSTLANLLLRLENLDSGQILIEGKDISKLKGKALRDFYKEIQIVFQDPYSSLDFNKKIGYLIEEPLIIHKMGNKKERKLRVVEMMKLVGLDPSYINNYPKVLSGGLRQRLAIAIALVLNPKFVVLDECVSALDVSIQAQVLNLLIDLQKKLNLTYLLITHDLNVVAYIADTIGVMQNGKIVEKKSCEELFKNPSHSYTKKLLESSYLN